MYPSSSVTKGLPNAPRTGQEKKHCWLFAQSQACSRAGGGTAVRTGQTIYRRGRPVFIVEVLRLRRTPALGKGPRHGQTPVSLAPAAGCTGRRASPVRCGGGVLLLQRAERGHPA